jgi:2-keto-3-deoxy-L-rhamnonate aldolase RhmA
LQEANRTTAVVLQAESRAAVDNIDSIAAVEGVDCILIGPYDLSASLGHIGEVTHPEVRSAIDAIAAACKQANVRLGIFGVTPEAVRPYQSQGFTLITVGVDTLLLGQAAAATLIELRQN